MVKAPPRRDVLVAWGQYGSISGVRIESRARLWLLAESTAQDAALTCVIAWNDPISGRPAWEDLGPVHQARIKGQARAEVALASGRSVSMIVAPCVCGAGAVGSAPPGPDRPRLTYVALPHDHPAVIWV